MFEFCRALQVSSLPRPIKTTLPGPMQLFSSTINASATPAIAVLDQPSSMESFMSMQPQLSAVYLRTTAAKRISTTEYQVRIFMMYKLILQKFQSTTAVCNYCFLAWLLSLRKGRFLVPGLALGKPGFGLPLQPQLYSN